MITGPWFVTAAAVHDYLALCDEDLSFDQAAERLQEIATDTVRPERQAKPHPTQGGYLEYRASRRYGKIRLIVSMEARAEGDQPQLIAVKR